MSDSKAKLFAAVAQVIDVDMAKHIDWEKVAELSGYKDGKNAQIMFKRYRGTGSVKKTPSDGKVTKKTSSSKKSMETKKASPNKIKTSSKSDAKDVAEQENDASI